MRFPEYAFPFLFIAEHVKGVSLEEQFFQVNSVLTVQLKSFKAFPRALSETSITNDSKDLKDPKRKVISRNTNCNKFL